MFSQFRSKDKNSNDENKTKNVNNNNKEKGEKNNNKDQQNNKDRDSKGSTDNKQDTKNKQTSNKETGGNNNNPNQKSKDTGKEAQSKHQQTRGDNGDGQGQSKVKHSEESRKTDKQTGEKNERNKQYGGNEERNKPYGGNDTHPGYKSYGDTSSNEQWKTSSSERNNEAGHKGKTNEQGYRDNRYVDNRGEGDQKKHHGQGKYTSDEYPTGGGGRDPYSRKQDDSHVTGIILIASEDKLPGHYKHHHQGDNARHNKYQEDARNTYQQGEEGRVKYPSGDMDGRNTHKEGTGEQFGSHQLHKDKRQQLLPAGDFAAKYNESIPAAGGEKHGADKFGGSGGGKTNEADKYQHRFNKGRKQKSSSLESSSEEELEDDVEKELKEIEEEEKRKKRDKKLGQMGKNSSSTSSGESMTKKLSEGFSKLGKK